MEYLGRLGLVPRKNKKERVTTLPHVADSKETRRCIAEKSAGGCNPRLSVDGAACALKTGPKCAIHEPSSGTAHTQVAGLVEIRGTSSTELPRPAAAVNIRDMADSFFPRTGASGQDAFIDEEFMQYQQHVQARAQALGNDHFGAPGGRHAWKTLIFWKRRHAMPTFGGRPLVSAASTPLHHATSQTPGAATSGRKARRSSRRAITPAMVPLYMSDELSTSSIQPWWEPMMRGGKMSVPGMQDAGYCNMSPYVPLGGRPQRLPAAPLYLV